MRGDGGVARVVGVPKFHSWGKCAMPLNSDWMSNASSGLFIINIVHYITRVLYFASWVLFFTYQKIPYSGNFSRGPIFAVDWQTTKTKPAK